MTTHTAIFFSHLEKCPYELPEGIKPHLEEALKKAYGANTTAVIAQKKPKQETGYNRFVKEKTIEMKAQNVPSETRMKQIRELWHQLSEQTQNEYTLKAGGTVKPKAKPSPKVDTLIVQVEAPVAKVEAPVAKVTVAAKKVPILKVTHNDAPIAQVEAPIAQVEAPIAKVEAPIAKVEAPIAKVEVEVPVKKSVVAKKAVVAKTEPVAKVEVVVKIDEPVAKIEVVSKVDESVAKVEVPVTKKEVVKTGPGYNHFKKVRTEELKKDTTLSGSDRVTKVNAEWKAMTEAKKVEWTNMSVSTC